MRIFIVREPFEQPPRGAARRRKAKPKPTRRQIRTKKWNDFQASIKRLAILMLIVLAAAILSLAVALVAAVLF